MAPSTAEDRLLADVQDAFAALARAMKRIALYRHRPDQHAAYLQPALVAMQALLEAHPRLTVTLEPTALLFNGHPVYSEATRESSFCFRLHRDGVRSLTFLSGVDAAELQVFFGAAMPDEQGSREDAVTELWKADLRKITFTAVSGYRLAALQRGASEEEESRAVDEAAQRAEQVLARFADEITDAEEAAARARPPLWTAAEVQRRDGESWEQLAARTAWTILRIVERGFASRDLGALAQTLDRLLTLMLEASAVDATSAALSGVAALPSTPAATELRRILGERLATPERLGALFGLASNPAAFNRVLPSWMELLPATAGSALLAAMEMEGARPVRKLVAAEVVDRLASCRQEVERSLRESGSETARALLAAISELPPQPRASLAANALRNPHGEVKAAAIPLLTGDPRTALLALGPLLLDAELGVPAAQAFGGLRASPQQAAGALIAAAQSGEFGKLARPHQTAIYRAIGALASDLGHAFLLERLAEKERGLFKRRADPDLLLAVQGLSAEITGRSLEALESAAQLPGRSVAVSAACRAAAAHVRALLGRQEAAR